ncbi:MAG: hypothetical protein AAF826_06255 [Pseudomonadota bacterium]
MSALKHTHQQIAPLMTGVIIFGFAANLLLLTGPLFMLQVYNRVVPTGSYETLIAMLVLATFCYVFMAIFDFIRARIMSEIAEIFGNAVEPGALVASVDGRSSEIDPLSDSAHVQRQIRSPAFLAALDCYWIPIFTLMFFALHPALGGALILILGFFGALSALQHLWSYDEGDQIQALQTRSASLGLAMRQNYTTLKAKGEFGKHARTWSALRGQQRVLEDRVHAHGDWFAATSKALRLYAQSLMLAVGAVLVFQNQIDVGVMIVASIFLGRILGPFELLLGAFPKLRDARDAYHRLRRLASNGPIPVGPKFGKPSVYTDMDLNPREAA